MLNGYILGDYLYAFGIALFYGLLLLQHRTPATRAPSPKEPSRNRCSQFLPPVATYAHRASISSGLSRSPHGGMAFLPFDTEVTKRSR